MPGRPGRPVRAGPLHRVGDGLQHPFKIWKRYGFNGGTADPCLIAWPAGLGHGARSGTGEARIKNQPGYDLERQAAAMLARE